MKKNSKKIKAMNEQLSSNNPLKFVSAEEYRQTKEGKSLVKRIWDKMRGNK